MLKLLCSTHIRDKSGLRRKEVGLQSSSKLIKDYLLNPELWRGSLCSISFVDPAFTNPDKLLKQDQEVRYVLSFLPDPLTEDSCLSFYDFKNGLWLQLSRLRFMDGQDKFGHEKAFNFLSELLSRSDYSLCEFDLEFSVPCEENNPAVSQFRKCLTFRWYPCGELDVY